jgi:hypothetical protein
MVETPAKGKRMGNNYCHWGTLPGFIELMEKGFSDNELYSQLHI